MKPQPPKRVLKFLRWFCREDYLDEIEGDLVELFEKRYCELPPAKAKWRFTWDVIRSFRLRNMKTLGTSHLINHIMLQHYIKIGGRNLLRNKTSSLINITGLTVGITCCLILFIFVKYESGFDNFHPYSKQTYRVVQHTKHPDQALYWNTTAYPLAEALRNDFHELELVTQAAGPMKRFFTIENEGVEDIQFESSFVLYVDPFYPKAFNLNWISGNQRTAFLHANSIVLTERIAKKCFGSVTTQSILGKTIMLNGKDPMQVTGVVGDAPGNTNLRYEILVPYEFFKQNNPYPANNWSGNYSGTTFVVLPKNRSVTDIESSITPWKRKYLNPEDDNRISYHLQPLESIHTETLYGSSSGGYTMPASILRGASFIGIFILLMAIANFINLVTARSVTRAKEVGLRKVIGSTRPDLFRQFILENTLLVLITLILASALSSVLLRQLNLALTKINLQLQLQWSDTGLMLLLGGVTSLLGTMYPATVLSSFKPLQIIKNDLSLGRTRGFSLRKALTVFQFTIVQLFVIAAIIVAAQMYLFKNKKLGFSSDAVMMIPVPQFDKLNAFKNSLLQNKDVSDVAFGSGPPMAVNGFSLGTRFHLPDQPGLEGLEAEMKIGDLNYLKFYDLELLSGRNFAANKDAFDEFIVNERLIKSFGWTPEEAIGQRIVINEGEAVIIGVTRDYHNTSLQNEITPCVILNWTSFHDQAFVRVNDLNPEVLQSIEKTWKKTFTTSAFRYDFVDDSIANEYFVETLSFSGFTLFSAIVIIIGCLGLFGLMAFITSRRTKEVGIRKVLGASISEIVIFFSKEFITLVLIAFVIAVPLAYYFMTLWLEGFTYRIDLSVWMFLTGGVATLVITILTSASQTVKAATANPVESLRSE